MTVAELIGALRTLPQDAEVVIDDLDTGWAVPVTEVSIYNEWVVVNSDGYRTAKDFPDNYTARKYT